MNEKDLFFEALDVAGAERSAFLDRVCAGDPEKRERLERLLASHSESDRFMEAPAVEQSRTGDAETCDLAGTMIGRYKLIELIGEGGFGSVYLAEQSAPVRRKVALKIIKPGMDTRQVVARFEAERQALAVMDHPNIAKVFDAGETETGRPFFVLELVRGTRITDFCEENALSIESRLKLFIQVCQALHHAHQKGIIHRDVKPSNILITLQDGVPVPKVIDFGIAKAVEGDLSGNTGLTQWHHFIGTPAYMSPEQAEMSSLGADTRTDVYGLGAVLYELLARRTPFDAKELTSSGLDEMRRTIREVDPIRPSARLSQHLAGDGGRRLTSAQSKIKNQKSKIDQDLDWIVMKCLEKDRARRYESAHDLALDLQRHLDSEPVIAAAPSTSYKLQKFVRRNGTAVLIVAIVAGLVIAGGATSTVLAIRALRAERQALGFRDAQLETNRKLQQQLAATEKERLRGDAEKAAAQANLYAANMNLAQEAARQDNFGRLRELLDETADFPERGFEWYYWRTKAHHALKYFHGHTETINAGAFSPDGTVAATASHDTTAKIWNLSTGRELLTLAGHTAPVRAVGWSPDGRSIATGSDDHTARIWEAATGREMLVLKTGGARAWAVAFSKDGQELVTGDSDGTLRAWSIPAGRERWRVQAHTRGIKSVAISPDGKQIATGSVDGLAKTWAADTGDAMATFAGHNDWITSVAFSPDGQRLLTACAGDLIARVWDAASGRALFDLAGHGFYVNSAVFSPDGQVIATGSQDRNVRLWSAATGKQLQTFIASKETITFVAFSPDGLSLLSGGDDATALLWKPGVLAEATTIFDHHSRTLAFSADSQRLACAGVDGLLKIFELRSSRSVMELRGHSGKILSAAFSPDGTRLATAGQDGTGRIWDTASGHELARCIGHEGEVAFVTFSASGERVITGGADSTVRVWDASTGAAIERIQTGTDTLAFSPDGKRMASAVKETVAIREVASGDLLARLSGHRGGLYSIKFSPDGKKMATGSYDHTAKIWDAATGRELLSLVHPTWVFSAAFSPDGQRVITAALTQPIVLWDAIAGRQLLVFPGGGTTYTTLFSPDGRSIAGNRDKEVVLWNAASPQEIASWEEEDRAAKDRTSRLLSERREKTRLAKQARAAEAGAIKEWLVLGPMPVVQRPPASRTIFSPAAAEPRDGQRELVNAAELVWRAAEFPDSIIDFNVFFRRENHWSAAAALCYLEAAEEQTSLRMLVGSDDYAEVILNGETIYSERGNRGFRADEDLIENVRLRAGRNVLLFTVGNETAEWKASLRFTDKDGKPVEGIKVTLDPE